MINRVKTNEISKHLGKKITVVGFLHAIRNQGKIGFIRIRDRFGSVQSVVLKNHESAFAALDGLTLESVVRVTGLAKEAPPVPEKVELEAEEIEVLSAAEPELPIPVVAEKGGGESDVTLRFDWRWLDLRLSDKQKIFQVWTSLEKGFRTVYEKEGFTQIYMPSFMNAPSESGAEVFEVNYFDRKAYLAQSPQFYKQMAMAAGFERVFMTGPVFRAELSFTTRHMTEFTGWDFEMSYIDSHHDVMDMEEKLLIEGFNQVQKDVLPELEIPTAPFPRLSLADAKTRLHQAGIVSEKVNDLSPDEERGICKIIKEETGSDFVWITDYPPENRAFYHMRHEDNPRLTKGFDLLYKGVEVTTGAQREHRVDVLIKQGNEKGLTEEGLGDYLKFFRYGCPPHGGVGMGPGRMVMQILDLESVKEATFLPRDVKRIRP